MKRPNLITPKFAMIALAIMAFGSMRVPAWGGLGHRLINGAAVDNLPPEMFDDGSGNAFNDWRNTIVNLSSRPDWIKGADAMESPRHWIDLDIRADEYPYPFATIPRDREDYLAVFERDDGVLAWEGYTEHWDGLVQAFRARNWHAVMVTAAELGHYVADSAQPFHASANYNGQLTGNDGIHSRYESELVNRFISMSDLTTRRSVPALTDDLQLIDDRVEFAFETLVQSFDRVDAILAADDSAFALDPDYGTVYYNELFSETGDLTIARLNSGAQRLADMWYSAWVEAGSPNFNPIPMAIEAPLLEPVIDGDLNDHVGQSVFQTNTTDFGNDENELDQMFVGRTGDSLVVGVAGNLEPRSAVILLLDVYPGGSSSDYISPGNDPFHALSGVEFAEGFEPDIAISFEVGFSAYEVKRYSFLAGGYSLLGQSPVPEFDLIHGGHVAFDNSNTGGVGSRDDRTALESESVRTGFEMALPFEEVFLPYPDGVTIGVVAVLLTSDDEISNQTLPGMPLGEFAPGSGSSETEIRDVGYAVFTLAEQSVTGLSQF